MFLFLFFSAGMWAELQPAFGMAVDNVFFSSTDIFIIIQIKKNVSLLNLEVGSHGCGVRLFLLSLPVLSPTVCGQVRLLCVFDSLSNLSSIDTHG